MPVTLRAIESVFIGGETRCAAGLPPVRARLSQGGEAVLHDPNGEHCVGQMYAQIYRLERPRHALPVMFWHGGGMTGANWESTPDGRPGWLWRTLEQGFDVIVCDAVERGRASWAMPALYGSEPLFRTHGEGWFMFRMGPREGYAAAPAARRPFPGQRFPVAAFESFARSWVPRWAGQEAATLDAYGSLLARVGPVLLVAHSQGGGLALAAACRHAGSIRALALLEPSGAPQDPDWPAQLPPHLVMWGDHMTDHPVWCRYRETVAQHGRAVRAHGGTWAEIDLPAEGICGNSHFPMMDDNSDALCERVLQWLAAQVSRRSPESRK